MLSRSPERLSEKLLSRSKAASAASQRMGHDPCPSHALRAAASAFRVTCPIMTRGKYTVYIRLNHVYVRKNHAHTKMD